MPQKTWRLGLALGLALILWPTPAFAVITAVTPLSGVLKESKYILTAKVETLDAEKKTAVLVVDESLKGKAPFSKFPVALKGDAEATKGDEVPKLLKRLAVKLPLVLFVLEREEEFIVFGYTNGTWFMLQGTKPEKGDPVWVFAHFEPYLRKTYKDPTESLRQVVVDVLAGRKKSAGRRQRRKAGYRARVT